MPCRSSPTSRGRARKLHESAATGIRASLGAVFISVVLGAIKVISGILGNSYALIADGVESMLDVVSGLVVAGSLKIAVQPPDERYPFGYGKIEPAAALVIAAACWPRPSASPSRAFARFDMPHHAPAPFTLVVLVVVVVIKEVVVSLSDAHGRLNRQQCNADRRLASSQ